MPNPITVDAELELALKSVLSATYHGGALAGYALYESQSSASIDDKARLVIACFDLGGELEHAGIHDVGTHLILYTPTKDAGGDEGSQVALHQAALQALLAIFDRLRMEAVVAQLNAARPALLVSCFTRDGEPRRGQSPEKTCWVYDLPFTFVAALAPVV